MKIYYRGDIVLTNDIDLSYEQKIGLYESGMISLIDYIEKSYNEETQVLLRRYLRELFGSNLCWVGNDKIIKILSDVCSKVNNNISIKKHHTSKLNIVYEIVTDSKGNSYAKEIYTGLLFPLTINTSFFNYMINCDVPGKANYYRYMLYARKKLTFPGFELAGSCLINNQVCDKNRLEEYVNQFQNPLLKNYKRKKIQRLANMNVMNPNVKIQEKNTQDIREKQSKTTSFMENIEYLLSILKVRNEDLYKNLKQEYENLLKVDNLTYEPLVILESKIEFALTFQGQDAVDIIEYLNNLKRDGLVTLLTNPMEKTSLTLEKINKINELFLKQKSNYDVLTQREVIKNLAFLYVVEVYENKDSITLEELENSYFNDNLKSIILCIKALQEVGLINCNYLFDLEEISCEHVFEAIKNIEFNSINEQLVEGISEKNSVIFRRAVF